MPENPTERDKAIEFITKIYSEISTLLESGKKGKYRIRISRKNAELLASLDESDIPPEYLYNFHENGPDAFDGLRLPKIVPPFLPVYVAKNKGEEPLSPEGFVIEDL